LGAHQACRGGEQTLTVQRQAIEQLFEIDFDTESLRSIPPSGGAHTLDFLLPIREISTEKFGGVRKNQPSSIALCTKEVTMSLRMNERFPIHNACRCEVIGIDAFFLANCNRQQQNR
jgi:hypothetical protein